MRFVTKGIQISLITHGIIFTLMLYLGSAMIPEKRPIVIDFTMPEPSDRGLRHESPQKAAVREKRVVPQKEAKTPLPARSAPVPAEARPLPEPPAPDLSSRAALPPVAHAPAASDRAEGMTGASSAHETLRPGGSATGVPAGETKSAFARENDGGEAAKRRYSKEHFAYIADLIMKNLAYPAMARKMGWTGKVTVSFIVCENGFVEDVRIAKSSGFPILDKNAIDTVKRACPFPKPPVRAELNIPIAYKLQ